MAGSRQIDQRSHRLPRLLAMLAAAAAFSIVGTAWAHDDETSIKASEHVLQAIAYIVNSPGNMMRSATSSRMPRSPATPRASTLRWSVRLRRRWRPTT